MARRVAQMADTFESERRLLYPIGEPVTLYSGDFKHAQELNRGQDAERQDEEKHGKILLSPKQCKVNRCRRGKATHVL